MSQYNKLSDFHVYDISYWLCTSYFGLFWSAGIPTVN